VHVDDRPAAEVRLRNVETMPRVLLDEAHGQVEGVAARRLQQRAEGWVVGAGSDAQLVDHVLQVVVGQRQLWEQEQVHALRHRLVNARQVRAQVGGHVTQLGADLGQAQRDFHRRPSSSLFQGRAGVE